MMHCRKHNLISQLHRGGWLGFVWVFLAMFPSSSFAQTDTNDIQKLDTVSVKGKWLHAKKQGLYDMASAAESPNINGFYALQLMDEDLGQQVWISKEPKCVQIKKETGNAQKGNNYIRLTWDKIGGGCTWIGMGIGWDNWQPKDMSGLRDAASLSFQFKSTGDTLRSLPFAIAFEDYTGAQCWLGFSSKLIATPISNSSWTEVSIPLSMFPFESFKTDPSMIKQFLLQLEADGEILIDNICLKPL